MDAIVVFDGGIAFFVLSPFLCISDCSLSFLPRNRLFVNWMMRSIQEIDGYLGDRYLLLRDVNEYTGIVSSCAERRMKLVSSSLTS